MQPEIIADYACTCGEGPAWHPLEKRVYWTDIETGRMFRYDPAASGASGASGGVSGAKRHEQFYTGPRVGGFTIEPDGSLLLFRDKGNIALWRDGKVVRTVVESIPAEAGGRFNDVIADPEGRVFCGTLTDHGGYPGRLYRLDRDGRLTLLRDGVGVCNGMGFSPDLQRFYFTDTLKHTIFVFDYDRATGNLSNEKVFVRSPDDEGMPDGMTVDAAGDVWSTRWDGSRLVRFGPDGKEKERVMFPTGKVSSCTFGGDDYRDLYVTTAGGDDKKKNGETAGALFRLRPGPGVQGRPEFFSRIG